MQNIQNADFQSSERNQDKENTLSKSADTISTTELILNLNDSFIARKSKEYNFDFSKASSYDTTLSISSGLLGVKQENLFYSSFAEQKPKEVKFTGRKTSYHMSPNVENKLENFDSDFYYDDNYFSNNLANKKKDILISKSANLEKNKGKFIISANSESISNFEVSNNYFIQNPNTINKNNGSNGNSNCNYFFNLDNEINKENGLKSQQTISKFTRNTSSDAFKRLKERMQILNQQKKNFLEFFEAKTQKEESDIENDNPNVYFE